MDYPAWNLVTSWLKEEHFSFSQICCVFDFEYSSRKFSLDFLPSKPFPWTHDSRNERRNWVYPIAERRWWLANCWKTSGKLIISGEEWYKADHLFFFACRSEHFPRDRFHVLARRLETLRRCRSRNKFIVYASRLPSSNLFDWIHEENLLRLRIGNSHLTTPARPSYTIIEKNTSDKFIYFIP